MKLSEKMRQAVADKDAVLVAKIAIHLMFKCGMNYHQTYDLFQKHTGIEIGEYDELIREGE